MHLSDKILVDFSTLEGRRRGRATRHLADCPACRARLASARELRRAAFEATAADAPDAFAAIEARLNDGPPVILPVPPTTERERRTRFSRSAAVALFVSATATGAAAATISWTPLGEWLFGRSEPVNAAATSEAGVETTASVGVELEVPEQGVVMELENVGPDVRLHVSIGAGSFLEVAAVGDMGSSRFRTGASGVVVANTSAGTISMRAPVMSGPVRVMSNGVALAVVRDGVIYDAGSQPVSDLDRRVDELVQQSRDDTR